MERVTAAALVTEAAKGRHIGKPYSRLDCQALVEQLIKDCGVKNPQTGRAWNWRGSNDMWRNAVHDRHPMSDGTPPEGAWVFTIKHDGGEVKRGYHDNMGNAAHVGQYLSGGVVQHSTTGGVQWDTINSKRWTHWAMVNVVVYDQGQGGCICPNCSNYSTCKRGE